MGLCFTEKDTTKMFQWDSGTMGLNFTEKAINIFSQGLMRQWDYGTVGLWDYETMGLLD